jgi:hypothetical protein
MTDWVERWKAGGEAGDAHAMAEALTEDAVLVSPLTDQFVFRGRAEIAELLGCVFEVFHDIHFTDDLRGNGRAALFAEGRVGGRTLAETQHLILAEDGHIREVALAMRPLPAVTRFLRLLGPRVARSQGHSGIAGLLTTAGTFLDSIAASGDRRFIPLARPASAREPGGR